MRLLLLIMGWILFLSPSHEFKYKNQKLNVEIIVCAKRPQVIQLAKATYAEARGESDLGLQWVAQAIINRHKAWCISIDSVLKQKGQFDGNSHVYTQRCYDLCKEVYLSDTSLHDYKYFLNPFISTDTMWLNYALKQKGVMLGNHWFHNVID